MAPRVATRGMWHGHDFCHTCHTTPYGGVACGKWHVAVTWMWTAETCKKLRVERVVMKTQKTARCLVEGYIVRLPAILVLMWFAWWVGWMVGTFVRCLG